MSTYQITEEEGRALIALIELNPVWQVEVLYHQLCAEFGSTEDHDEEAGIAEDLDAIDDEPGPKLTKLLTEPTVFDDPNRRFQMYTPAGNLAVAILVADVQRRADSGEFQNRAEMAAFTRDRMEEMGRVKITAEVHDTEPRCAIADALDAICRDKGWAYNDWETGL